MSTKISTNYVSYSPGLPNEKNKKIKNNSWEFVRNSRTLLANPGKFTDQEVIDSC